MLQLFFLEHSHLKYRLPENIIAYFVSECPKTRQHFGIPEGSIL